MNYVLLVFVFSFQILGFAYLKYESFFYLFGTFLLRKLGTLRLLITKKDSSDHCVSLSTDLYTTDFIFNHEKH